MDKQLIKVEVNQNNEQAVSARELHEKLGIQKRFSAWWADQIERLNLKENYDYCTSRYTNANNQDFEDCIVSIDIAKHICMISGGEQAHVIREYFIAVERAWNSPEQVMARALQYAQNQLDTYKDRLLIAEKTVKELAPAAVFGNAVSNNAGGILVRDYVKILENDGIKIGQDKLFSWLHLNGYIYRQKGYKPQWIPYKQYIEQGLFRVKETPVSSPQYGDWISITMRVTGKGQKYFYEKLKATA
jgi:anti-repressor protein